MATPADRRAAQRKLAKQIKTDTFKPSSVGTQARKVASKSKLDLIERVTQLRIDLYGNEAKRDYDRKHLVIQDPDSGTKRTVGELRKIERALEGMIKKKGNRKWIPKHVWNEFDPDDYDLDEKDESAFYYH